MVQAGVPFQPPGYPTQNVGQDGLSVAVAVKNAMNDALKSDVTSQAQPGGPHQMLSQFQASPQSADQFSPPLLNLQSQQMVPSSTATATLSLPLPTTVSGLTNGIDQQTVSIVSTHFRRFLCYIRSALW